MSIPVQILKSPPLREGPKYTNAIYQHSHLCKQKLTPLLSVLMYLICRTRQTARKKPPPYGGDLHILLVIYRLPSIANNCLLIVLSLLFVHSVLLSEIMAFIFEDLIVQIVSLCLCISMRVGGSLPTQAPCRRPDT